MKLDILASQLDSALSEPLFDTTEFDGVVTYTPKTESFGLITKLRQELSEFSHDISTLNIPAIQRRIGEYLPTVDETRKFDENPISKVEYDSKKQQVTFYSTSNTLFRLLQGNENVGRGIKFLPPKKDKDGLYTVNVKPEDAYWAVQNAIANMVDDHKLAPEQAAFLKQVEKDICNLCIPSGNKLPTAAKHTTLYHVSTQGASEDKTPSNHKWQWIKKKGNPESGIKQVLCDWDRGVMTIKVNKNSTLLATITDVSKNSSVSDSHAYISFRVVNKAGQFTSLEGIEQNIARSESLTKIDKEFFAELAAAVKDAPDALKRKAIEAAKVAYPSEVSHQKLLIGNEGRSSPFL